MVKSGEKFTVKISLNLEMFSWSQAVIFQLIQIDTSNYLVVINR